MRYYTILAVCSVFLCVSVSSWAGDNVYIRTKADLSTSASKSASGMKGEALRGWLKSVKPAAGNRQPGVRKATPVNYWQQTVTRSRRR